MIERLSDVSDERLAPYRRMKERTLRGENVFIAEGELVVGRLIESRYGVRSVLLTERLLVRMQAVLQSLPPVTPIFVLEENELRNLVGFEYYQGVLAVGGRRDYLPLEMLRKQPATEKSCWIVLPDTTKPDNLGLIFRSCAALGADGVILGRQCCDPFSRRALRVSMGGVLRVPIYRSENIAEELLRLQADGILDLYATVLDPAAIPLPNLAVWPQRTAFVFGNEFDGLVEPWLSGCRHRTTIPIVSGVDSLNLGVAVGIFLYEYSQNRQH